MSDLVLSTDHEDRINEAMALPKDGVLRDQDGNREFHVISWSPHCPLKGDVTIKMEVRSYFRRPVGD